jgi:hypothetical protein
MLYLLRLSNGDCVLALAADEHGARQAALQLNSDSNSTIVSLRPLDDLAVQFSPTEDGSLDVTRWSDATLDGILSKEYPFLEQAFRRANAQAFQRPTSSRPASLDDLKAWHEQNTQIIREGLQIERNKFSQAPSNEKRSQKVSTARRSKTKSHASR